MYRRSGFVVAMVAGVVVVSACGSGGSDAGPTAAASPSSAGGTPSASASPGTAPDGPVFLGPTGYGTVQLGMSRDKAESTGLITVKTEPPGAMGCGTFDLRKFPQKKSSAGGYFSAELGIASIFAVEDMRTPEGIALGSSTAEVEKAYPKLRKGPNASFTVVPGNPKAVYTFLIDGGRVQELVLDLAEQTCHN
ncbi:hypothetical protein BZB76_6413 [Actinomadura pelletieri DSM 43383]|uniref:Lipoprotein n=1 Tax=Actinomadura pelletieri DSM 43383 TaxID=1120940 RepID=A0A495Q9J1_9ACTN|nr:hypothetical protein [Actinomadura pelletieri]RKS68165.1 hypothetical protein BZB76_6413 [Actinomadura pelletieri DSM 43383]